MSRGTHVGKVLCVDDDLLGAVEGPEDLVVVVLLHPGPGERRRPQLDRVRLHPQPLDAGGQRQRRRHPQHHNGDGVAGAGRAPRREEGRHGVLHPDAQAVAGRQRLGRVAQREAAVGLLVELARGGGCRGEEATCFLFFFKIALLSYLCAPSCYQTNKMSWTFHMKRPISLSWCQK